jgi:8-oxo-dGTP diphosphatase
MKKVARAIIIANDKFLLGKRGRNDAVGKWALIGGKPEEGELIENAIVREVQEELGLIFHPTFWMKEIDDTFGQGEPWEVSYFWGTAEGAVNFNKEEILDVGFFEEKDLKGLDIAFDHKKILEKFLRDAIK